MFARKDTSQRECLTDFSVWVTCMRNLRVFIKELEKRREIVHVDALVDPKLEIAEIHRRVIAEQGPALLFTNVKGSRFPVLTNMFGTQSRVDLAFGNRPKEFVARAAKLPQELLPPSVAKLWGLRSFAKDAIKVGIRSRSPWFSAFSPVTQRRMSSPNLSELPALTSWSEDGGPFLTLPLVHTRGSDGHPDNLGMYRVQIHNAHETGMHFQIGKGGGFHLLQHEQRKENLPTNIYLGGPPGLILSAVAPLPENVPELLLASLMQGSRLAVQAQSDHPLAMVSEAEFCLSGEVVHTLRKDEGPFGDHYGYYSLVHPYPVFRPRNVYHRKDAIFPATVVGKPRQEDFFIGDYLQELLLPLISVVMPGVRDLWSYGETGYHALASAVLHERYGRESMSTAFRILGEGQLALTKFLIATDHPQDLRNFPRLLEHVLERFDPRCDLHVFSHTAMDSLDYSTKVINKGSKGLLLGLGEKKRDLPKVPPASLPSPWQNYGVFVPGCLVMEGKEFREKDPDISQLLGRTELDAWPLIILVDDLKKTLRSTAAFLWTTFTRFDPAMDIHSRKTEVVNNHVQFHGPILIDARLKPWYPKELFCDPETALLVNNRWKEYFGGQNVKMGSSDLGHL